MPFWNKFRKKASKVGKLVSFGKTGQPVWMSRDYESFAREGYERNVIAYRCIMMIAQAASSIQWEVYQGEKKQKKHKLYNILARPNKLQSGADLIEAMISYKLISGNSYVEAAYPGASMEPSNKPPTYLYVLRPDRMNILPNDQGQPAGYRYTANGQHKDFPVNRKGDSNILHMRQFHPTDDWYGMSGTEAAAFSIDQHNASAAWNQALLQNGASPSGAIIASGEVDDEQFESIKQMIDERYSSPKNAGRPMFLEGGLDFKQIGNTPKDMDWLEGRREAAREIALAFGVPPMLLGIPGDNTYSNQREARLALWEETILPLLNSITESFNHWLVPRYGENLKLSFDKENISALRLRREMQRESLEGATFLTINEKREAMGLEPQDGGDVLYIDSGKIPLGMEVDLTAKNAAEAMQKSLKDMGFSDEEIERQMLNNPVLEKENN